MMGKIKMWRLLFPVNFGIEGILQKICPTLKISFGPQIPTFAVQLILHGMAFALEQTCIILKFPLGRSNRPPM